MEREDVLKLLVGSESTQHEYLPVACLLKSGYACLGYFNLAINETLQSSMVLLNMRLADLRMDESHSRRTKIADFNDFLQDVVMRHVNGEEESAEDDEEGTIPLTAIPLNEISLMYPVSRIADLLKTARKMGGSAVQAEIPTFLDFNNKSIVLKVLRTKLW